MKDSSNDCYFCQYDFTGCAIAKKKKRIVYPNLQSAMHPVEHLENIPLLKPPDQEMQSSSSAEEHSSGENVESNDPESENKPIPFSQEALNDLRRDVYLIKEKSEFLASRLQERNLFEKGVKITLYRKLTEDLLALFTMKDDLCFCNDITELFEQLEILYDKTNWRLFIDISEDSIKSVLLHNGNTLPSVPIAYSTTMKKSYENLKAILTSMQYDDLNWHICANFKFVAMQISHQLGYTNFCRILCLWNSRAKAHHLYARIGRYKIKLSKENTTSSTNHL